MCCTGITAKFIRVPCRYKVLQEVMERLLRLASQIYHCLFRLIVSNPCPTKCRFTFLGSRLFRCGSLGLNRFVGVGERCTFSFFHFFICFFSSLGFCNWDGMGQVWLSVPCAGQLEPVKRSPIRSIPDPGRGVRSSLLIYCAKAHALLE